MKTISLLIIFCIGMPCLLQTEIHAQSKSSKPRIINEEQVKIYWVKKFPIPRKLARDYHTQKKNYKKLISNINAGKYDHSAKVKALEWNIKEYQRVKNFQMANQCRLDMNALIKQEAERKRADEAETRARIADSRAAATSNTLRRLENHLQNIEITLRGY